jgi:hypothetical protein
MPVRLLLLAGGWALFALWRRRPRRRPVVGETLPPVEGTVGVAPRGGWHTPDE